MMLQIVRRKPLLFILLAALLIRIPAAVALQFRLDGQSGRRFLIAGDAEGYWELGKKMAAGEEYALHHPPRRVMRMPGFPALLAGSMKLFGESELAARLLLAAVGTIGCLLVYLLGKELFDEATGLIAAGWTTFSPAMSVFSVMILSETLFAVGLLASLLLMAKLTRTAPLGTARLVVLSVLAGVAIAIACYVRPSWLLAAPLFSSVFVVWMASKNRLGTGVVAGLLVVVGMFVALTPWTIRNYRVTGHAVMTTLWVGPSLYDGLHPGATGSSNMTFFDRDKLMQQMSEYEVDRHYRREAWNFFAHNPMRAVELSAIKAWRYWKPWPNAAQFGGVFPALLIALFFIPAVLLAAYGLWLNRNRFWACALTAGPILYFAAIHAVFIGSLRYRLPAEYPLYVLSAAGLHSLWKGSADLKRNLVAE